VKCCDKDMLNRPSFEEILQVLETVTSDEVNRQNYFRYGAEGHTAAFRKDKMELDDNNMVGDLHI
jgi:hypothetical protein